MPLPNHINPDHFLNLAEAQVVTLDDVRAAWEQAYAQLDVALRQQAPNATLYLVFGIQLDLPPRRHRQRALAIAKAADCRTIVGVWIDTPLPLAMARNATRPGLSRIREEAMHHVHERLEPPSLDEGFTRLIHVRPEAASNGL